MAAVEQRHANIWTEKLKAAGVKVPPYHPSWRTRTLGWFAQRFGAITVLPSVMSLEQADTQKYSQVAENQLICLGKETSI